MQKIKNTKVLQALVAVALILVVIMLLVQCTSPTKVFSVTFDADGGSSIATQSVTSGEVVALPDDPVKDGYRFLYWELGDEEYDFSTKITKDITLKAIYGQADRFSIKLDFGDRVETVLATDGILEKPIDPTREGYKFVYWELDGKEFVFSNPISSDLALVAKWEPMTYNVSFNSNGGSVLPSQTIVYGGSISKPSNPTRDGFIFVGWFLSDEEYDFTKVVASDLELLAKWEADETGNEGSTPKTDPAVTTKTETKTSVIAYKTVRQNDSTLEEGKTTVEQRGQNGEITITYTVTYTDGKETGRTETSRKINKQPVDEIILVGTKEVDTTAPVITLLGDAIENVANGAAYTDAGATATDDVDGDITARIAVAGDTVNTAIAGTYVVTYNVSDAAGNAAPEVTRTVIVAEAIAVRWITVSWITDSPEDRPEKFLHTDREAVHGSIQATIFPENATNKNVVWSSSNTAVATVVDGEVTVRAVDYRDRGLVIITATTIDGSKTARAIVSSATQAETRAYWSYNETFKEDIFDTLDLTKEEDLRRVEGPLNNEHFDRMVANLPPVDGKDAFLERYLSFRTTVNAARATFNNLQIEKAIELISGATYTMTQETATDEAIIKSTIEGTIEREISSISLYNEVAATVNKVEYTPAVAADAANPTGINGTYSFTVDVSNSSAAGSTATLTMTIIATPFVDRP